MDTQNNIEFYIMIHFNAFHTLSTRNVQNKAFYASADHTLRGKVFFCNLHCLVPLE